MLKTIALFGLVLGSATSQASSTCTAMFAKAETSIIESRVNFYKDVLKANTLEGARGTAVWNHEISKITTLKMATDDLNAIQLDALSRAGCQPWQGAEFNMKISTAVNSAVLKIFTASSSKAGAYDHLTRLAAVKRLSELNTFATAIDER